LENVDGMPDLSLIKTWWYTENFLGCSFCYQISLLFLKSIQKVLTFLAEIYKNINYPPILN